MNSQAPNFSVIEALKLASRHHQGGRFADAEALYKKVLEARPDNADALQLLGVLYSQKGEGPEAVRLIARAIELSPANASYHDNLGLVLKGLNDFEAAIAAHRRSIQLRPRLATGHNNLGLALKDNGQVEEALAAYRHALGLDPAYLDAKKNMANLFEQLNRIEEAKLLAEEALRENPAEPYFNLVMARCERSAGQHQEAVDRLQKIDLAMADSEMAKEVHFALGQLLDRRGEIDTAFEHFIEGNRLNQVAAIQMNVDKETFIKGIEIFSANLIARPVDSWTQQLELPESDERQPPVFLIGFPRSGTTLLGQILDSHPDFVTLDEKLLVRGMERAAAAMPGGYPGCLKNMTGDQISRLRDVYFDSAAALIKIAPGQRLIDKMPLNLLNIPIMWRVFPSAKFIFAVRHPFDVCLSCFMNSFELTNSMANFFSLQDAARLYCRIMELWQQYKKAIPFDRHTVRYEFLVEDFDAEVGRLLTFLGAEWDDEVSTYYDKAQQHSFVKTPSYHQITKPIYKGASGRWRRYEKYLSPIRGVLASHIEALGYEQS